MSRLDDAIGAKVKKRQNLEKKGVKVHPYSFEKKHAIKKARQLDEGSVIKTAGRIMSKRPHGKVVFLDLKDSTSEIQIMIREGEIPNEQLDLLGDIDPGDFLGITGKLMKTRTGELTVLAQEITILGKALRPLPSEWNVAEDKDVRFRQRYIDMLINDDVKQVLDTRWMVEKIIRRYLQDEFNFVEVETPVLQPLYGGTNARPFTTHMRALDVDLYLRIAPELYLKRLIVGGYERIFEIARNFRNEGIDQTHQPEFTMIEWYHAYADYQQMMDVAEGLFKRLVAAVSEDGEIMVGESKINVSGDWPRVRMIDALKKYATLDFNNLTDDEIKQTLKDNSIEFPAKYSRGKAMFELFDKLVAPKLIQPTWIIDYPRDVSPLSKVHRLDSDYCERFEAYVAGKELADGWSEVVDPIDQRQLFENEQMHMRGGDEEAHPLDEEFLEAMEYGMPPLGGIGIGIDRLVMFLTNTWSIREVIPFPTLKPKVEIEAVAKKSSIKSSIKTEQPSENKNPEHEKDDSALVSRKKSEQLLQKYIKDDNLRHHCQMVAQAMQAYAKKLGHDEELWYQTGLLHDLDWEKYPDEHPNKAVSEFLLDYPSQLIQAVRAHAPERTGVEPTAMLDKYLFACDEISGFMHAYSLMRPTGFVGMKSKKVKKRLKDKSFAANVSRDHIAKGFELIEQEADEHIRFLIDVFN